MPAFRLLPFLLFWLPFGAVTSHAQDSPSQPYRMHAYVNLVQVPTLVLDGSFQPVADIQPSAFRISLDGGPKFVPTTVHVEGNDPLSLGILFDASADMDSLLNRFPDALAGLAANGLNPQDQVTFFAADCVLAVSVEPLPPRPDVLRHAAENVLRYPPLHDAKRKPSCSSQLKLWDDMAQVARIMLQQHGRRVLLVVSPGTDHHSKLRIDQLFDIMAHNGIAVFTMNDFFNGRNDPPIAGHIGRLGTLTSTFDGSLTETDLTRLARDNGGVSFRTRPEEVPTDLAELVRLLRFRYILEFHRPDSLSGGFHDIAVSVDHRKDVVAIRSTGVSVLTMDESVRTDPLTVPSTPSEAIDGKQTPKHRN